MERRKNTHKHTQRNFFKIHIQNNDKSSEKKGRLVDAKCCGGREGGIKNMKLSRVR